MYTENERNARKVKYLEFKINIENILGRLSESWMGSFGQITKNQKTSCKCTCKVRGGKGTGVELFCPQFRHTAK